LTAPEPGFARIHRHGEREEVYPVLEGGGSGEHHGRDGEAFADWDAERGAPPQEVPLPEDLATDER